MLHMQGLEPYYKGKLLYMPAETNRNALKLGQKAAKRVKKGPNLSKKCLI